MPKTRFPARLLPLTLPFVWQVLLAPFANEVAWQPLGLPFQMVWQMVGVVLATLAIGCVFLMDDRAEKRGSSHDDGAGA